MSDRTWITCVGCHHHKLLHDNNTTIAQMANASAGTWSFEGGHDLPDGHCHGCRCDCPSFQAPPLTIELDPEQAYAFVSADSSAREMQEATAHITWAINQAREAQR